ncbi:MAG: tRNA (guanosine(37)-N1)-methyltransferase TrmD [Candidatus Izemoplasma sp.]|nr:tRNA (guanosine(37)-N1)-methyltransferase TrmD [Candidatus Izemoplasma sp.]
MRIDVLTLFPDMFEGVLNNSIIKRAIEQDLVTINLIDFRKFSTDKHHKVDDTPYGGGAGMVLQVEPVHAALQSIKGYKHALKIIMTPQGVKYTQKKAYTLSEEDHLIILCGHYEGFDERIRQFFDLELSIGDYVLTGGEIAAMTIIDSVVRLLDGAIGQAASHEEDSFSENLLEYPQYTRPREYKGMTVPDVLLSGHHENIKAWRKEQAIKRTKERRPDLYKIFNEQTGE